MKFTYRKYSVGLELAEYPAFRISLNNASTQYNFSDYMVLVDSGASVCVFHGVVGEVLGFDIKKGRRGLFSGVTTESGELFLHKVILTIEDYSFEAEVGFSYDLNMPWGLLGQQGFFDQFRVCFDKSKSEFEITPKAK